MQPGPDANEMKTGHGGDDNVPYVRGALSGRWPRRTSPSAARPALAAPSLKLGPGTTLAQGAVRRSPCKRRDGSGPALHRARYRGDSRTPRGSLLRAPASGLHSQRAPPQARSMTPRAGGRRARCGRQPARRATARLPHRRSTAGAKCVWRPRVAPISSRLRGPSGGGFLRAHERLACTAWGYNYAPPDAPPVVM
jgi:hypothetical protein